MEGCQSLPGPRLPQCRRVALPCADGILNILTSEVNANAEALADGEFMLTEFVDRFGPRLAHLNGVLQVLAQLGSAGQRRASRVVTTQ